MYFICAFFVDINDDDDDDDDDDEGGGCEAADVEEAEGITDGTKAME